MDLYTCLSDAVLSLGHCFTFMLNLELADFKTPSQNCVYVQVLLGSACGSAVLSHVLPFALRKWSETISRQLVWAQDGRPLPVITHTHPDVLLSAMPVLTFQAAVLLSLRRLSERQLLQKINYFFKTALSLEV